MMMMNLATFNFCLTVDITAYGLSSLITGWAGSVTEIFGIAAIGFSDCPDEDYPSARNITMSQL